MVLPSICIPSIGTRITKNNIRHVFQSMGGLEKIVIKRKGKYCSAFIYMKSWNLKSEKAIEFRKKLVDGEEINLIYDFPWFWKCRANRDIRELQFNKLKNKTKTQEDVIYKLNQENWKLKSYTRWLGSRII